MVVKVVQSGLQAQASLTKMVYQAEGQPSKLDYDH